MNSHQSFERHWILEFFFIRKYNLWLLKQIQMIQNKCVCFIYKSELEISNFFRFFFVQ